MTRASYEALGYAARTWYLASCPYDDGTWQRDAWQAGAWKWQQEQRALLRANHATAEDS